MVNSLSSSPVPLAGFTPLPVSPDKKGYYDNDIDNHTHGKKPRHGIILLNPLDWRRLPRIGGKGTVNRNRIGCIHSQVSMLWSPSSPLTPGYN